MKKTASAISRGLTKQAARFKLPSAKTVGKTLIKPVTPFKPTRTGRIAKEEAWAAVNGAEEASLA